MKPSEAERAKLERVRAEVQKGMGDLAKGRFIEISSDEDLDVLFTDAKRREAERRGAKFANEDA